MSMDQASLIAELKASLHDAASVFTAANDADIIRHLDMAALDLGRFRPRIRSGSITLVPDQPSYPAPSDMIAPHRFRWGDAEQLQRRPWTSTYPGRMPRLSLIGDPGAAEILLTPAPTQQQIHLLGSSMTLLYRAGHTIALQAADTTVRSTDRGLLLLRAQAEAMKELSSRNMKKPVSLRDGSNSTARNSTPAALYEQLMREFERQASC